MDIKNTAISAKVVIQSLIEVLGNEGIDAHSIKFKIGSTEEGCESEDLDFGKLIDLTLKELEEAKAQAVPEGFVLVKASDRNREVLELIDQRDYMEDQAEQLKDKLQELYGVDFGEHSSCNFPFQNAIDYNDSDLVLVPKEPTDKTIAHMINTPIEVNLLCDHADVFLSEGEAYIAYQAMIAAQEPAND